MKRIQEPRSSASGSLCHDVGLVRRTKKGDNEAFAELIRRYQDRIFNTCWRICGNIEEAGDLTQEAFLRAFSSIQDFREESSFYTWLFRVAVNLAMSQRRKQRRMCNLDVDDPSDAHGHRHGTAPTSAHDSQVARLETMEIHDRVVTAIGELEEEFRAVIVLRDIEGFDYSEIAEVLGIRLGTVKSRIHRARKVLRDRLGDLVGD